jgi:predicted aldo/keto reductase-like oxidoreductase
MSIPIPTIFSCMNDHTKLNLWKANYLYNKYTAEGGKASSCIECGACEAACPQKLPIRELLKKASDLFDK